MKIQEDGVHWSKDFVEHLRTVHFALIAVSVGLIALSLAHPIGPLERALKQLQEIEKVSEQGKSRIHAVGENYSDWVQDWAPVQVKRAIDEKQISPRIPEEQVIEAHGEVVSPRLSCSTDEGQRGYNLGQDWFLIHSADEEKLDQTFIRTQVPGEGNVIETAALGLPKDMKLDDFKRLWNVLNQHTIDIVVPIALRYKLYLWSGIEDRWDEYECVEEKPNVANANFLHFGLLTVPERWAKLAP